MSMIYPSVCFSLLDEVDAVPPPLIAQVTHLVDQAGNHIDAETVFPQAAEIRRRHSGGVKRFSQMMQAEDNAVRKSFRPDLNPLIRPVPIGMPHDVAQSFVHREIKLLRALLREGRSRDGPTKSVHKVARLREFAKIAWDLDLLAGERKFPLFDLDDHAGQIIRECPASTRPCPAMISLSSLIRTGCPKAASRGQKGQ